MTCIWVWSTKRLIRYVCRLWDMVFSCLRWSSQRTRPRRKTSSSVYDMYSLPATAASNSKISYSVLNHVLKPYHNLGKSYHILFYPVFRLTNRESCTRVYCVVRHDLKPGSHTWDKHKAQEHAKRRDVHVREDKHEKTEDRKVDSDNKVLLCLLHECSHWKI